MFSGKEEFKVKKVILYLNQFFGGIGGEDAADYKVSLLDGTVGPGAALQAQIKGGQITHTIICGDNYMNSHTSEALEELKSLLDGIEFDLFITGPAFMAGRYGVACATVCQFVKNHYQVPAITSMHEENPGKDMFPLDMYVLQGTDKAAGMRRDLAKIAALTNKFLNNEPILWAEEEGYFPRGIRKYVVLPKEQTAAKRAIDMLKKKLNGEPFETELPISSEDHVPIAAPVKDLSHARIAFVTTGGLVPHDNPDSIPGASSTRFGRYKIGDIDSLKPGEWICVHGGLDAVYANADPEVMVPLSALKQLQKEGKFGYLHPYFYSTTGNHTNKSNAVRMAREITEFLKEDHIDAVIFGSA